jgi:hypothetical protein
MQCLRYFPLISAVLMEGRRVMETMTLTRRRGSDGSLKSVSTALELLDCFESTGELG